ncbi:MAG TPA: hypothetical protein VIS96_03400 [Terrimicrobiaceae bacterium]
MGTELRPGSFNDVDPATMAKAMEEAFLTEWTPFNGEDLPPPEGKSLQALRLFFVAVSQGVVQHLRDNAAAFALTINSASHSHDGGEHVHGDGTHTHDGGSHSHGATVSEIKTTGTTS